MGNLTGNSRQQTSLFRFPIFPLPEGEGKGEREAGKKLMGKVDGKREREKRFCCAACHTEASQKGSGIRRVLGLRSKVCSRCKLPKGVLA